MISSCDFNYVVVGVGQMKIMIGWVRFEDLRHFAYVEGFYTFVFGLQLLYPVILHEFVGAVKVGAVSLKMIRWWSVEKR